MIFSAERRSLHDYIAGSKVVLYRAKLKKAEGKKIRPVRLKCLCGPWADAQFSCRQVMVVKSSFLARNTGPTTSESYQPTDLG